MRTINLFLISLLLLSSATSCTTQNIKDVNFNNFYKITCEVTGIYDYKTYTVQLGLSKELYTKNKTIYEENTFKIVEKIYVGDFLTFYYADQNYSNLKYILLNPSETTEPFNINDFESKGFQTNYIYPILTAIREDNSFIEIPMYEYREESTIYLIGRYQKDMFEKPVIFSYYVWEE